ncbi:MAG: hypothetical protein LBD96_02955 [Treponema sp.]|jgi:hypothetical protein|nr:hypothetical protein [Treponema sp.]
MKKHTWFFSAIAALALAVFSFSGCDAGLTDGAASGVDPSRSVTVQADLTGTKWLGNIEGDYGVTLIEFTSSTTAIGTLGNTEHQFKYNLVTPALNQYSLSETGKPYTWEFNINGNILTFAGNSFKPYSDNPGTFRRITFQTSATLDDLAGTNWLARGPRGESELYNITATGIGTYSLTGAFGPDAPGGFNITYKYDSTSHTGTGSMDRGAGPFTATDSTATLFFSDFWGHAQVTFNKFVFN